jgi:hypothetical protein
MAENHNPLARRVQQLQDDLQDKDPEQMAAQTGTCLEHGRGDQAYFQFEYWGEPVIYPAGQYLACRTGDSEPLQVIDQAMIAYYFHDSAGSPPAEGWISFSELPDGQFYHQAFQGYTARKLQHGFGTDYAGFESGCRALEGEPVEFASRAFRFQVLPRVSILAACWKGDEDFPPSYQILFNDTVSCHLPTDACAILGSMLTGKLLGAADR